MYIIYIRRTLMIQLKNIEVLKSKENFHYIAWEALPPDESVPPLAPEDDPDNYEYRVFWSNNILYGYNSLKDDNGNDIVIGSDNLQLGVTHMRKHFNFNNVYYYCIAAFYKNDSSLGIKSDPVYYGMFSDGVHVQIKHAEDTLYDMYYGEPGLIIKRKPFGLECPDCWSPERQQRTKSKCGKCQDTGKVTGYYKPIATQMSFDSDPVKSDVQHSFENVTDTKRSRMSNYPIVRPRDLIVNTDENKRYTVTHIETTKLPKRAVADNDPRKDYSDKSLSRQNYVVSQMLTLQEIVTDNQEYYMNYDEIPSTCDDYSLPRFQTHEPATGDGVVDVSDDQVVTLDYSTDFTINEEGKLELTNPLDQVGLLSIQYSLVDGVNTLSNIPSVGSALSPGVDVETTLKRVVISTDKSNNINASSANIRVSILPIGSSVEHDPDDLSNVIFVSDFGDTQVGLKFYEVYTINADDGSGNCPSVVADNNIFVDIDPNNGWTFENIRVTLELELKVA